jgi:hypothetical protein
MGMTEKHQSGFKTREQAAAYLEQCGWKLSTIFPASGSLIFEFANGRVGVHQLPSGYWYIVRDQAILKSW